MSDPQPTKRFSERVPYYHQYRPRYPAAVLDLMTSRMGLTTDSVIADIGAGTGILSELFLKHGNRVYAVEPNQDMREAAIQHYGTFPNFIPLDGTAEVTTLSDASADFVTCGQAFHWFDPPKAKTEFRRILKPAGYVILVWNTRPESETSFLEAYNRLMREFDVDGTESRTHGINQGDSQGIRDFFAPNDFEQQIFYNHQRVSDFEGLRGRVLSASYMPLPGHPRYDALMERLRDIFDAYQQDGAVQMDYVTDIYWGKLS